MSLAELIRGVDEAPEEDRQALAVYLRCLNHDGHADNTVDLDQRMREMDAGNKVSLKEMERIHEALKTLGR
ncbi:MAG: hypothetical protein HY360_03050 [Verrucomicrobia bacterium]|nr:hypothetical protein [Verrucomicrobiota bacterium]